MYRTRIGWHARTFQGMYSTLRNADPSLPVTVPHVVRMHSKALFFQPVAHRNDLRLTGMPWGLIRMDVSRKNERHIVTLLSHTLADQLRHCFVAIIDLRIKKEERYFLQLCKLKGIANQIQHSLAAPPIVNFLPSRIGKQLLAKGVDLGVVFNRFV